MGSFFGGPGRRGAHLGGPGMIDSLAFLSCASLCRCAASFCSLVTGYSKSSSLFMAAVSSSE